MDVRGIIAFVLMSCTAHSAALLFHGDGTQAQATTMGPLGKDATLSLLVQEVLDLKTKVRSQDQEILTLKGHQTFENNVTTSTLNQLMSEFVDIKLAFRIIKQEFDQTNNLTGLQAITKRLDNMAQSIRYLTLSQQVHEIHFEENNRTLNQELDELNATLASLQRDQDSTNRTLMKEVLSLDHLEDLHRLDISTLNTSISTLESNMIGVRLVGGDSTSGRVEIFYHGVWGTVCDDRFDENNNAARVVCAMLGKNTTHAAVIDPAEGTLPILLDDVVCTGSESDLFECAHQPVYTHNCGHGEDVGVRCG